MSNPIHDLYHVAVAADEALSQALARKYGKAAGDMRYHPAMWKDEELSRLRLAKIAADNAYLDACRYGIRRDVENG